MSTTTPVVAFEHAGIGTALKKYRLEVPPNQRDYSWEDEHVHDLFGDIQNSISSNQSYFLGTIVFMQDAVPKVVDGQQRLTTTTIFIAAVRDYFKRIGDENLWQSLDRDFLQNFDRDVRDNMPKLTLNTVDNLFFRTYILTTRNNGEPRSGTPTKASHKLIARAAQLADERIEQITKGFNLQADKTKVLLDWIKFIEERATVIVMGVPDGLNAYKMFETLNDRGLKTSQADLLKNYLFGESGTRLPEAQEKWSKMVSSLETLDIREDDVTVSYLRQLAGILYGLTRTPDVFDTLQKNVTGQYTALEFSEQLSQYADDYAAMHTSSHIRWSGYSQEFRDNIETLLLLRVGRIKPLMLAATHHFSEEELEKAFACFVAWSVRIIIVGVSGGQQELAWTMAGNKITKGEIKTTAELIAATSSATSDPLLKIIPTDDLFEAAFSILRVSNHELGRYYLRQLEGVENASNQEVTPLNNSAVNLEHVLPKNPSSSWAVSKEVVADYSKRIGNLALLNAGRNNDIGNDAFVDKIPIFEQSSIKLTKNIATKYGPGRVWGPLQIEERQKYLASLAIKAWPIK